MTTRHPLIGAQVVYKDKPWDVVRVTSTMDGPRLHLRTFNREVHTIGAPADCRVLDRTHEPDTP